MLVYKDAKIQLNSPAVLALGCFDGVHIGHKAVINEAKQIAVSLGLSLAVFTFSEPPRNFFSPCSVPLICTKEKKLELLQENGVDIAVCVNLSKEILSTKADEFINDILIGRMNALHIVCGYNYTFGKNALGNVGLISDICKRKSIGVTVIPKFMYKNTPVSSSLIRQSISEGKTEYASKLLGRPFSICSTVVNGQHLARRLGFPTVNIIPESKQILPKNGVYVTRVSFDGIKKFGITNVGVRPTVNTELLCVETHIFDFDGDLYGKEICVEFLHFLREEKKFSSVESMASQILSDIDTAKEFISKNYI